MKELVLITPEEVARSLGKSDPEQIRAALRAGVFPVGYAYKTDEARGKWVYIIPRKAWERFLETGRAVVVEPDITAEVVTAIEEVRKIAEASLSKVSAIENALAKKKRKGVVA